MHDFVLDPKFYRPSSSFFEHDKYCFVHDFLGSNDFLEYFFVVFFSKTRVSKITQMIFLKENELKRDFKLFD